MELKVNGAPLLISRETITLLELLREQFQLDKDAPGIAVARNWSVVPRGEWETTTLRQGDEIEVITARQGG
jgi:sulfur carrier protein